MRLIIGVVLLLVAGALGALDVSMLAPTHSVLLKKYSVPLKKKIRDGIMTLFDGNVSVSVSNDNVENGSFKIHSDNFSVTLTGKYAITSRNLDFAVFATPPTDGNKWIVIGSSLFGATGYSANIEVLTVILFPLSGENPRIFQLSSFFGSINNFFLLPHQQGNRVGFICVKLYRVGGVDNYVCNWFMFNRNGLINTTSLENLIVLQDSPNGIKKIHEVPEDIKENFKLRYPDVLDDDD